MADVVQYRLERMSNELDDLEQRGLFTRLEIAEIVKHRRKFEYRLKRPSPLKQDFMAYIDYETQLDSLRRLRKKSVARELKKQEIGAAEKKPKKKKKSVSDFAGVVRIADIYNQAVKRYKGDIDLWFRYLEFCRQRRNGNMKKVLAQAIRFHTKVPGIWIYSAAWEFDHDLNVAAARALMQRGLRFCPTSEDLWIEYLRMELTYLNKLKARKVALGEDQGTLTQDKRVADEKQWRDENEDLFMSLNDGGENDEVTVESEGKVDVFREQGFNVLRTIYGGAIEALPSSFVLRKRFFEILEAVDLAHMEEMRDQILSDMKRDFSTEPEYWVWLAKLEYDPDSTEKMSEETVHSRTQKAVQVFEEAVEALPLAKMFDLYAKFLMGVIISLKGETEISRLSNQYETYVSRLLMVCEKAERMGCITEDLACQHVSYYLQLGRLDDARNLAEKHCSGKFSDSISLWVLRASIEVKRVTRNSASPTKADLAFIYGLIKDVLAKASILKAESLWLMALKLLSCKRKYFDKLVEISIVALAKDGGSDDGFSLSSAIVNFIFQKDGIHNARDTYKRFLALPHPGFAIYRNCIELESNLASIGDKDGLVNARKLYESVLTTYSQNASLWKNYYQFESNIGTSETASTVYWRARKTLKDASALIALDV